MIAWDSPTDFLDDFDFHVDSLFNYPWESDVRNHYELYYHFYSCGAVEDKYRMFPRRPSVKRRHEIVM